MKILIIIGIIAFISFSVWIAKRNGVTSEFKSKDIEISTHPDEAIDFGYKMVWIAAKTDKKERIAEILELKNIKSSNWASGI